MMFYRFFVVLISLFIYHKSMSMEIIRDDEIETTIKNITAPIVKAANLPQDSINIYIINDKQLNAFTNGGMHIFINSGLITAFDDPAVLQGVIAHEIGHIIAGHIVQRIQQRELLQKQAIFSTLLGLLGSFATKSSEIGVGTIVANNEIFKKNYLKFSRQQESEADLIALKLLHKTKSSNQGLIKLLSKLSEQSYEFSLDPYLLTHPLSEGRINNIRNFNIEKDTTYEQFSYEIKRSYLTSIAKIRAFTENPELVLKEYNEDNIISDYVRSIVYYRQNNFQKSIPLIEKLCIKEPNNPYFEELRGQMYLDQGNFLKSVIAYEEALHKLPNSSLIKMQLAISKINLANKNNKIHLLNEAITLLNTIRLTSDDNIMIYHYLAVAYGKIGNIGAAKLALAEKFLLEGKKEESKKFATQAIKLFQKDNDLIKKNRAEDIIMTID